MFDILFGWRKASKCKKLIRRVQCRLKLLKNKRSTIVRQLRDDVAELLKHGRSQSAFDRVEQIIKDENLVAMYDLLENFCEFIIINLPYIRRSKDCPNDINEAVSTLIFASARFGDLPELRLIRKLFGERYGQRFETVALELLPGNLVNRQMRKKLCTTSVPDEVKNKVMVEIAGSALKSGPLLLEYSSELQQLANKGRDDPILSIETSNGGNGVHSPHAPNIKDAEKVIVYVDLSSENKKFLKDLCPSFMSSKTAFLSTSSLTVHQSSLDTVESSMVKKNGIVLTSAHKINPSGSISGLEQIEGEDEGRALHLAHDEGSAVVESSSESSAEQPVEMIYLDDIQEFEPPVRKEGSLQDQRLFMFKSSVVPMTGKIDNVNDQGLEEQHYTGYSNSASSRSFRKSKKVSCKRLRRRSFSIDITSTKDVECAIYYGESCDSSPNYDQQCHDTRKHHKKIPIKQHKKSYFAQEITDSPSFIKVRSSFTFDCSHKHRRSSSRCSMNNRIMKDCSLENPCYSCISDEKNDWNLSPRMPKIEHRLSRDQCSCNMKQDNQEVGGIFQHKSSKKFEEDAASSPSFISSHSRVSSPWTSKEKKPSYSRATTMPIERPNDGVNDSYLRSNSFPFEHPGRCSSNRHVHPMLPDYDELEAKFTALQRANLHSQKQ